MKPLHELDALCAEKVAGWKWRKNLGTAAGYQSVSPMSEAGQTLYGAPHECFADAPPYTTDPAAASYATARSKTLKECADIVRKFYPELPT